MRLRLLPVVYGIGAVTLLTGAAWWFRPVLSDLFAYAPEVGDVVLQSLPSSRLVDAIEGITNSRYSHCGVVDRIDGRWVVVEALGIVHATPLREWMLRGHGAGVTVYRYPFAPGEAERVLTAVHGFDGRPYDIRYDLDDAKIL